MTGISHRPASLALFLALVAVTASRCPATAGVDAPGGTPDASPWLHPWGEPGSDDTLLVVLRNSAYDCGYTPSLHVARWAAYAYTRTAGEYLGRHSGSFRADPRLDSASGPIPLDYRGLWTANLDGYDRGHQAPDATLKVFGAEAQAETYYLSNITPQHSRFNQGIWRELENLARDWVGASDTVWLVTGPVFYAGQETLRLGTRGRLAGPHAYFKAAARRRPGRSEEPAGAQTVAVVVPHRPERMPRDSLSSFVVGVDSVERLTGLSLFPMLARSSRVPRPGDWPGLTGDR